MSEIGVVLWCSIATYIGINYQVLSDTEKKKDYDEKLRKEESKSVMQKSPSTSHQVRIYGQSILAEIVRKSVICNIIRGKKFLISTHESRKTCFGATMIFSAPDILFVALHNIL